MSNPSTFGGRIKQLRQEHGLTQDTLAERVGCATQTIRKIEAGQRRPSFQIAAKLAQELGIAPEDRACFVRFSRDEPGAEQIDLPTPFASETQPADLAPPPSNLPTPLTRLIGREQEVMHAQQLLLREDVRLLTLVGPGGAGKTRLAVELAAGLEDQFADGVVFVNLVPVHDLALVVPAIADAVGIGEEGARPRLDRLKDGLRAKRLLLVLDNFEQVVPAAGLVAELLSSCPGVKALVTSREVLRVRGEQVFVVQPLLVPNSKCATANDLLSQSAAVQLFAERAAAARPGFAITDQNAPAIARLCQRLDGLPLAIELAAARSMLFAPEAMLARLGSRLKLLTGGPRDLPARQQTLRNTIAWSYDLLTDSEQKVFRRLCVFISGRTLDAIEAVCTAAGDIELEIVDVIASLVDKSLLWQDAATSHEPQFLMLETIREFGLEQLEHSGEAEATQQAHANYYLQLVEQCEPHLWGGSQEQWLDRLEQEHGNLRVALAWCLETESVVSGSLSVAANPDQSIAPHIQRSPDEKASQARRYEPRATDHGSRTEMALRMAGRLWRFWSVRGHWTEGQRLLEQALSRPGGAAPTHRWLALHGAGNLSLDLGEYARAKAYYEESLAVTRQLKMQRGIANSLLNLSQVAFYQGDLQRALTLQEESLAIHRAIGNQIGIALSLHNLAAILEQQGHYDRAAPLAEESLARYRDLGDSLGTALALHDLALLARHYEAYERAGKLFEEGRTIYEKLGAKNDLARALNDLGELAEDQGKYTSASALYEESLRLAAELGDRRCQAIALTSLAQLAHRMGDDERAVALYNKSLSLRRDLGDTWGAAKVLESLGRIVRQQGRISIQAYYTSDDGAAFVHRSECLVLATTAAA
jgi:predicted ATPase/DNA-binding XRE family transcriptional regulator